MTHTPAPWHIEDETIRANTTKDGQVTIATVRGWIPEFHDEGYANKVLIAAAPELLDALRFMLENPDDKAVSIALRAIAKATSTN